MKINNLYSDIDENIIDTLYNKLKKFKLKKPIKNNINDYNIQFYKTKFNLPLNTRFNILSNYIKLNFNINNFNKYWNKNFDNLNKWNNYLNKYSDFKSKQDLLLYNKLVLSKFVSQNVINNIINRTAWYTTIIGNNRNIIIFGKSKKEVNEYISKTLLALDYFNIFYINRSKLNLFIFLSDEKKIFPNDNFYTPYNVNTAYAISKIEVVLFRKEEFEKVLFHELIHFYQLDVFHYQNSIRKNLPIYKFKINPNEAYTDFFAIVLHLLYVNYVTKKSLKNLIKIELGFINHQAKKILKYSKSNSIKNLKMFNQSTSVFSYFILKSAMFNNLKIISSFDLTKFSISISLISNSITNKNWNKLIFNKNNKFLKSNNLRMSFISKFLKN